jgi:hypothetical protein
MLGKFCYWGGSMIDQATLQERKWKKELKRRKERKLKARLYAQGVIGIKAYDQRKKNRMLKAKRRVTA